MPLPVARPQFPHVAVLLATHNGMRWLPEQVESILGQQRVSVRIIASDDRSSDGTESWLRDLAAVDSRVLVLPPAPTGSAAANFYHLLMHAPLQVDELVAFADQDDIWIPDKLARHAIELSRHSADGVSSNVIAFSTSGNRTLVRKDFPQRDFDFLLESPGPGSTFLMSPRLAKAVADVLRVDPEARDVDYHDWLVYAVARAKAWRWHIDAQPSVEYRQHDGNAMGANVGPRAARSRFQLIRRKWHREQAARLARISERLSPTPQLTHIRSLLESTGLRSRIGLARNAGRLRRRPRDRAIIAVLIVVGAW